jgi:hypothetical protein
MTTCGGRPCAECVSIPICERGFSQKAYLSELEPIVERGIAYVAKLSTNGYRCVLFLERGLSAVRDFIGMLGLRMLDCQPDLEQRVKQG